MSLRAFLWTVDDPRCSTLHASALRVLLALADHAHEDGTSAWSSASRLAERLAVSERTIERCIAQLREKGLIRLGDQRLVEHQRADRRPVVWDLDMPGSPSAPATVTDGQGAPRADTADGPSDQAEDGAPTPPRADAVDGPSSHGPSRNAARAVTNPVNGPTPGVGQNRHLPTRNRPSRARPASARSVGDLAAVNGHTGPDGGDAGAVAYCRRCGHQHVPGSSCTRSALPAPPGGLRALRDREMSA